MGFQNSPPYVQRQIDTLLRPCKAFARAYIDDIAIFCRVLSDHKDHLHQVFQLCDKKRIRLSFIGYPSVQLLDHKVDVLGLTTNYEKLEAICLLKFLRTLKQLEHDLGLTGWLGTHISGHARKAEPLQRRKTELLKKAPAAKGEAVRPSQRRPQSKTCQPRWQQLG